MGDLAGEREEAGRSWSGVQVRVIWGEREGGGLLGGGVSTL